MNALSLELTIFGQPLILVALIALVFATLQGERAWSRRRRRQGLEPGTVAYLLDGLVLVGVVLAFAAGATLFVQGLKSISMLIVGMAIALGLALALVWVASRRRAAQPVAGARAPIGPERSATEASLAGAPAQQAHEPLREHFEEEQPLAMLQQRWQPSAVSTASVPTSFLDLVEPPRPRSRFALASTLLSLALVVLLVSGAVLFRHQLTNIISGIEASYSTAGASDGGSPGQIDAGAENAAANVGAATASVASAPTAASLSTPAASLADSDAQGAQKHVKTSGLNLRALPGLDQQVVMVLKQGDAVIVFTDARLIQGATWVKVRAGDKEGWVDQSLLE